MDVIFDRIFPDEVSWGVYLTNIHILYESSLRDRQNVATNPP